MKIWIKIEDLINKLLTFLFGGLGASLSKLTPKSIPKMLEAISTFKAKLALWLQQFQANFKRNSQAKFQDLKSINVSKVTDSIKAEMNQFKGKKPKEMLTQPFTNFFQKLSQMEPRKAVGMLALIAITGLSIFSIVFSGGRIYERTRSVASIPEVEIPPRPVYYKADQKQVNFSTVKVPIYSQGKTNIQFLTADFELQMSNRLSVIYIREHETMIRDHLINHVEPMDSQFTLETEGKSIIKEKLKKEINVFLDKEKVEGKVDDINIIYLLGT